MTKKPAEKGKELGDPPKPKNEFISEVVVLVWNNAILPNMKPTVVGGELIGAKELFKVDKILEMSRAYLDACYQQGMKQAEYDILLKEKADGELRESSGKDKSDDPRGSAKKDKRDTTRKDAASEEKTSNAKGK